MEKYCELFYIRGQKSAGLREDIKALTSWEKVTINDAVCEVTSMDYIPFKSKNDKSYRLVILRRPSKKKQMDLFTGDEMTYQTILTNDLQSDEAAIIAFYDQRGRSERIFSVMNNDFGWSALPFSKLAENTVFLIVMAMVSAIYQYLLSLYAPNFPLLKPNYRLKKFIFRFVSLATRWVVRKGQKVLRIFDPRPYQSLYPSPG